MRLFHLDSVVAGIGIDLPARSRLPLRSRRVRLAPFLEIPGVFPFRVGGLAAHTGDSFA
jgi:hypothetical protein